MTDKSKRTSVGFWTTIVVLVVVVGYPLSFGPACWIASRFDGGGPVIAVTYQPLMQIWWRGEADYSRHNVLARYANFGSGGSYWMFYPVDRGWYEASWSHEPQGKFNVI